MGEEAAPVEEDASPSDESIIEEANMMAVDSDNDDESEVGTSSRLNISSITALMAKSEAGELSQQEFYRVFLMTVQNGLTATQRLEDLEARLAIAEAKLNTEHPAVADAAEEDAAEVVVAEEVAAEEVAAEEIATEKAAEEDVEETAAAEESVAEELTEKEHVVEEPEVIEEEKVVEAVTEDKTEEVDISTMVAAAEKMRPSRKRGKASQSARSSQSPITTAKRQRRAR